MSSEEIILETAKYNSIYPKIKLKKLVSLEKFVDLELVSKSEIEKN